MCSRFLCFVFIHIYHVSDVVILNNKDNYSYLENMVTKYIALFPSRYGFTFLTRAMLRSLGGDAGGRVATLEEKVARALDAHVSRESSQRRWSTSPATTFEAELA